MSANMNQESGGISNHGWLVLLAVGFGLAWLSGAFDSGAKDDFGNKVGAGERLFYVDYTSPDQEYIITKKVAAKTEAQAIAEAKHQLKSEGEVMRGAQWDAYEV